MNRSFIMKATTVATLSIGGIAMAASSAAAQQELNFVGSARVLNQPGSGGANLLIDFTPPTNGGVGSIRAVDVTTLPGVAVGTNGTIADLVASNTTFLNLPVSPFVSIGGYTFTLNATTPGTTFGPITLTPQLSPNGQTNTIASFAVGGTVTGGAFGASIRQYTGSFTAQFNNTDPVALFNQINSGGTRRVSFSADFTLATVPEPSTYALMASGVAMLGMFARRRRQQA